MKVWQGRWVKFADNKNLLTGAHHARDGRVVGVFCRGETTVNDGKETKHPDYIVVVDGIGENLLLEIPGVGPQIARVDAAHAPFLEGVTSREDIPAARLAKTAPDWQPAQDRDVGGWHLGRKVTEI